MNWTEYGIHDAVTQKLLDVLTQVEVMRKLPLARSTAAMRAEEAHRDLADLVEQGEEPRLDTENNEGHRKALFAALGLDMPAEGEG